MKYAPIVFLAAAILTATTTLQAAPQTLTVAADGSGEFTTIQAALDTIPDDNRERIVLAIQDGLYEERIRIDQNCVTLRGESRDGVRIQFNFPRSEYDRRYDKTGPAVVNVFGFDVVIENLTIENTQQSREHAFAIYGQPNRMILADCDVLSNGGDTVSLWNTAHGMYYHNNCRFTGGVDFVCPRGWCFVRDCQLECPTTSAAIWHDGHMDLDMKFVLRGCEFTGTENFWIGRNHYPSQFYLLDCKFGENMADKPIETVSEPKPGEDPAIYERKYFHNCHRDGGDYAWHADNLGKAAGSPTPDEVTPSWTFDGKWDPESTEPPEVTSVEVDGDDVHLHFSEAVVGAANVRVVRGDSSVAEYASGNGTDRLVFRGGSADSPPQRLELAGDELYGTVATLEVRYLPAQDLPSATPVQQTSLLLIGDSTVADYEFDHAYQGWGRAVRRLFDERVSVTNMARGGRSSKSFRDEGWWDKAREHPADYVLIQFGHNDNPGKGPERHTEPGPDGEFRANLRRYVEETRAMGAVPVLVSPPTRRFYDDNGQIKSDEGNVPYAVATLAVARELDCAVVDLNRLTTDLFNRLGEVASDWIQPIGDRTHFTPAGAYRIAALVVDELQEQAPPLEPFVEQDALVTRYRPSFATAEPTRSEHEPLAPKFWKTRDDKASDPPEQPLYPDGEANLKENVTERVDDRTPDHHNRWVSGIREPTLTYFPADGDHRTETAVVVCPGGGYAGLAYDKEGYDTARWLNSLGVTAVVLKYRCREYGQPIPGNDAQQAIATVRRRADELGVAPDRIGIMGYSAGGHVASTAGTRFREIEIDGQTISSRPDFMILVYPVISMDQAITHQGSRLGLLGQQASQELVEKFSNERHVTKQTPPTFLVHAADDRAVPMENSLRLMRALENAEVPVELAAYEHGGHGFGLVADPIPAADWPRRCETWLRAQRLLPQD